MNFNLYLLICLIIEPSSNIEFMMSKRDSKDLHVVSVTREHQTIFIKIVKS